MRNNTVPIGVFVCTNQPIESVVPFHYNLTVKSRRCLAVVYSSVYASPSLLKQEKGAWERAYIEFSGNSGSYIIIA